MNRKQLQNLYGYIYDSLFAGEFNKPPMVILTRPSAECAVYTAWRLEDGRWAHEIELFIDVHENMLDVADSMVHELVHAMQQVSGRPLNHKRYFTNTLKNKMMELMEVFGETCSE